MKKENIERNLQIVLAVNHGEKYSPVGRRHGLSGTTVKRIFNQHTRIAAKHHEVDHDCTYGQKEMRRHILSAEQIISYFDAMSSTTFTVQDEELYGLGDRIRRIFKRHNINTKKDVLEGIKTGMIKARFVSGYGHQSHGIVCRFVGVEPTYIRDRSKIINSYIKYLEAFNYQVTYLG